MPESTIPDWILKAVREVYLKAYHIDRAGNRGLGPIMSCRFDSDVAAEIIAAHAPQAAPVPEKLRIIPLTERLPDRDKIVWVLRRWIPGHVTSDGKERTEWRLAVRRTDAPLNTDPDTSRHTYWSPWNDVIGTFSDTTVAGWCEVEPPAAYPSLLAALGEAERALEAAQEELRLIRMKDTNVVYDPTLKVRIRAALSTLQALRPPEVK